MIGRGIVNNAAGVTFHADGTWTASSVAEMGEVLFDPPPELGLGPLRLGEGAHTPMRGAWRATGPDTFEAVGFSLARRTGAAGTPEDPATTLIDRTHLRAEISEENPDAISALSKTVALFCLNQAGEFDQFSCPDPTLNLPSFDEVFFLGPDGQVVLAPEGEPLPTPTAPMELRRLRVNVGPAIHGAWVRGAELQVTWSGKALEKRATLDGPGTEISTAGRTRRLPIEGAQGFLVPK